MRIAIAMAPVGVEVMKQNRHTVWIEKHAGKPSGFEDADYEHAGGETWHHPTINLTVLK